MIGASTWHRFKTNRRFLKIKFVETGDSGIFVCKGVNGFGSKSVQIQLVVRGKNQCLNFITKASSLFANWNLMQQSYLNGTSLNFYKTLSIYCILSVVLITNFLCCNATNEVKLNAKWFIIQILGIVFAFSSLLYKNLKNYLQWSTFQPFH